MNDSDPRCSNKSFSRPVVVRQSLASLADNFSAPYIGYYLAALTSSGVLQGILQFSLNSLPTLAQVLLGSFIDRLRKYIMILLITSVTASSLWILISLTLDPLILVGLYTLRAVAVGISGLALIAFIGAFYSSHERGKILSTITIASQITALLAFVTVGFLINPSIDLLRILFIVSGIISLIGSLIWLNMLYLDSCLESSERKSSEISISKSFKIILENRSFMKFDYAFSGYILAMSFAWPYFAVAQVYLYRMSVSDLAILNIISTLSTMISQYILMKILPRTDLKKLVIISRIGFVTPPLFYAVSPNIEYIYISNLIIGPFQAITNVVIPLYTLEVSEKRFQASHLAFLNFSQGVTAAVGSIIGGFTMDRFVRLYGYEGLRIGFAISTVFRILTTIPFIKIDKVR
ncbi:MAG: hypothetical protein QXE32_03545 [Sulfolobales archaeon]